MKSDKIKNCKTVRDRLRKMLLKSFQLHDSRLYEHILNCPKCQSRIIPLGKVDNALNIIKSGRHSKNLLAKANQQAIGVLQNSLRNNPATIKLENIEPKPSLRTILTRYNQKIASTAACLVVFLLIKTHIFNSIQDFQSSGNRIVNNYYQRQLGSDLANELGKS